MKCNRIFPLFFAVCALGAPASAATIVFNFDADNLGTATNFTDTVNGLSATFSSSADPGGFIVLPTMFETLTGNVLGDPGPAGQDNLALNIDFSQQVTAVTLNFATSDFGTPSPFTLNAYRNSVLVGSNTLSGMFLPGFQFPEGEIAFDGASFNRITLSSTATDFAVDNILVSTAPEPGPLALILPGILLLAVGSLRAKSRRGVGLPACPSESTR